MHRGRVPAAEGRACRSRRGYAGGTIAQPDATSRCATGETGHAEVVQVRFDPAQREATSNCSRVFFKTHDPTTLNRQGADVGTQYRSVIFTHDAAQKKTAEAVKAAARRGQGLRPAHRHRDHAAARPSTRPRTTTRATTTRTRGPGTAAS
ncbi:MAG: peptide-methionine (S)-S-oxide reductase [Ottowia sp.]